MLSVRIAHRQSLCEVIVRIRRVARRKIDRDDADRGTHAAGKRGARRSLRVEIHVAEAGDAAAQHLGAGEQRAVVDEFRGDVLRLGGPDGVIQPPHERHVVGQPAHQRHRRMRVQVDQTGNQRVTRQVEAARCIVARGRVRGRKDGDDFPVLDRDTVVIEHRCVGFDGNDPARVNQAIDRFHSIPKPRVSAGPQDARRPGPLMEMIARRLGARHAISCLRFFASGQNFIVFKFISLLVRAPGGRAPGRQSPINHTLNACAPAKSKRATDWGAGLAPVKRRRGPECIASRGAFPVVPALGSC